MIKVKIHTLQGKLENPTSSYDYAEARAQFIWIFIVQSIQLLFDVSFTVATFLFD